MNQARIEQQLNKLYSDLAVWQKKAEKDIQTKNWNGLAATNCTIIHAKINALEFVLYDKPLAPVYEDSGAPYSLMPNKRRKIMKEQAS